MVYILSLLYIYIYIVIRVNYLDATTRWLCYTEPYVSALSKKKSTNTIKTTRLSYNRRARIVSCRGPSRPYRRRRRWRVATSS